jgi:hypothetical protein
MPDFAVIINLSRQIDLIINGWVAQVSQMDFLSWIKLPKHAAWPIVFVTGFGAVWSSSA